MRAGAAMSLHRLLNGGKFSVKAHGELVKTHPSAQIVITINPPTRSSVSLYDPGAGVGSRRCRTASSPATAVGSRLVGSPSRPLIKERPKPVHHRCGGTRRAGRAGTNTPVQLAPPLGASTFVLVDSERARPPRSSPDPASTAGTRRAAAVAGRRAAKGFQESSPARSSASVLEVRSRGEVSEPMRDVATELSVPMRPW
jgi:hypothetical protein